MLVQIAPLGTPSLETYSNEAMRLAPAHLGDKPTSKTKPLTNKLGATCLFSYINYMLAIF